MFLSGRITWPGDGFGFRWTDDEGNGWRSLSTETAGLSELDFEGEPDGTSGGTPNELRFIGSGDPPLTTGDIPLTPSAPVPLEVGR